MGSLNEKIQGHQPHTWPNPRPERQTEPTARATAPLGGAMPPFAASGTRAPRACPVQFMSSSQGRCPSLRTQISSGL